MDNLRRNERNIIYHNQQRNDINRNNQADNNNMPRHLNKTRDFDMNLYERGRNWQQNGLPLSGASEELKRNMAFIKGYNRENQISRINGKRRDI